MAETKPAAPAKDERKPYAPPELISLGVIGTANGPAPPSDGLFSDS